MSPSQLTRGEVLPPYLVKDRKNEAREKQVLGNAFLDRSVGTRSKAVFSVPGDCVGQDVHSS